MVYVWHMSYGRSLSAMLTHLRFQPTTFTQIMSDCRVQHSHVKSRLMSRQGAVAYQTSKTTIFNVIKASKNVKNSRCYILMNGTSKNSGEYSETVPKQQILH